MPAVNFDLMFQAMVQAKGATSTRSSTGRAAGLEEPDAHAQPRHDLPHAVLQHEGRRPDGAGDSAGRRDGSITGSVDDAWQTALEDVGPAGVDKGKGGKYLILPPGYKDKVPDGYIALPSPTYAGFAHPALQSQERQRRRRRQGRRLRQARQGLSAVAGGEPAGDDVRRRDRRRVRQHHSLRPALLRVARPLRAARAVARARQGDDRSAQDDRHREGQAVRARREDEDDPERRRRAKRTPGSTHVRGGSSRRRSTKARTGRLPASPEVGEGLMTNFRRPDAYPVDGRGVAYSLRLLQRQASGRPGSTT